MGLNGRKNAPQAGRGVGTGLAMPTERVTRNGAAAAPGETATGMADMTDRQTLEKIGTTGNGRVGIEEIAIAIEKGTRTGTGTVVAMSIPADEWPGSCAFPCRTRPSSVLVCRIQVTQLNDFVVPGTRPALSLRSVPVAIQCCSLI
jgi:hypothetical protein